MIIHNRTIMRIVMKEFASSYSLQLDLFLNPMANQQAGFSENRSWCPEVTYRSLEVCFFSIAQLPMSCLKLIMGLLKDIQVNSALGFWDHLKANLLWARPIKPEKSTEKQIERSHTGQICSKFNHSKGLGVRGTFETTTLKFLYLLYNPSACIFL